MRGSINLVDLETNEKHLSHHRSSTKTLQGHSLTKRIATSEATRIEQYLKKEATVWYNIPPSEANKLLKLIIFKLFNTEQSLVQVLKDCRSVFTSQVISRMYKVKSNTKYFKIKLPMAITIQMR